MAILLAILLLPLIQAYTFPLSTALTWIPYAHYTAPDFFDAFTFLPGTSLSSPDFHAASGFANFTTAETAFDQQLALINRNGAATIMADTTSKTEGHERRRSVRIATTESFTHGLFIIDVARFPSGCGVTPAIYMLSEDDIDRHAEKQAVPSVSGGGIGLLQSDGDGKKKGFSVNMPPGCFLGSQEDWASAYTGKTTASRSVCATRIIQGASADEVPGMGGECHESMRYISSTAKDLGAQIDADGGGVTAMIWDRDGIRMWEWAREAVPADVRLGTPRPSGWGVPVATFVARMDPVYPSKCHHEIFHRMVLVLSVDICGGGEKSVRKRHWEEKKEGEKGKCPADCKKSANDPTNLPNTAMEINSIAVFQVGGMTVARPDGEDASGVPESRFGAAWRGLSAAVAVVATAAGVF